MCSNKEPEAKSQRTESVHYRTHVAGKRLRENKFIKNKKEGRVKKEGSGEGEGKEKKKTERREKDYIIHYIYIL